MLPGAAPTLVGTGPATADARAVLSARSREVLLSLDSVARIVLTHSGLAHAGLCGELHRLTGAPVYAHPAAAAFLSGFDAAWEARTAFHLRAARAAAVPPAIVDAFAAALNARAGLGSPVAPDALRPLADAAQLRMGDATWTVLHAPGPAADHACFHHAPSGTLLGGDLLARNAPTTLALEPRREDGSRPQTLADLIRSWRRIGGLPLHVVWAARGPAVRAHRVLIARRLAGTRRRLLAARRALSGGAGTIWEVACALDPEPPPPDTLDDCLGETVALLDWLVDRGLARRTVREGVVRLESK